MADNRQKFKEAERKILGNLDIASEYAALGLRLAAGGRVSRKGWLQAHGHGREDNEPSAGVNIGADGLRGRYKDFAGPNAGRTLSLWDFAVLTGKFSTWSDARLHFARKAGVELPKGDDERVVDRFDFGGAATPLMLKAFAAGKPGVTIEALRRMGATQTRWPRGLPPEKQNHLLSFGMYGGSLLNSDATGWHSVNQMPGKPIRQYQGKGRPEKLVPSMSAGEGGLMNEFALACWGAAEIVWVTEGISDLLAIQAAMVDLDDDRANLEVCTSTGGCKCFPSPEVLQLFAGKDVRVVFDVGDKDNAGQVGAKSWCGLLLKVAKSVRNVELPPGANGGKNDLRAWLAGLDGNQPHGYEDLVALAETFDPLTADDAEALETPSTALLKSLALTVLGETEDGRSIFVYCERTEKAREIRDINRLSHPGLIQICGPEVVNEHVTEVAKEGSIAAAGKAKIADVRAAIAGEAAAKVYYVDQTFGAGVWRIDDALVLVQAKEVAVLRDGETKLERSVMPSYGGRVLDTGQKFGRWFDAGALQRYLNEAQRPEWCQGVFSEAVAVFGQWPWRYKSAAVVCASLATCTWIQTTWNLRPYVGITGPSNNGKSTLMKKIVNNLYGSLAWGPDEVTEPSLRQEVEHHACVVLLDEFESCPHRPAIIKTLRTCLNGGFIGRGGRDQKAKRFGMKHIAWMSAIELGLHAEADKNRAIILEIENMPRDRLGRVSIPRPDHLADLGQRLLAVAISHWRQAEAIASELQRRTFDNVPGRVSQLFSLVAGMYGAVMGWDVEASAGWLTKLLTEWDFGLQQGGDQGDLISEILCSEVRLAGGRSLTVGQLLNQENMGGEDVTALNRVGVSKQRHRPRGKASALLNGEFDPKYLFLHPKSIQANLLRPTSPYRAQKIEQHLMRIAGAERMKNRLGAKEPKLGIGIPLDVIQEMLREGSTDDQDASDDASIQHEEGF